MNLSKNLNSVEPNWITNSLEMLNRAIKKNKETKGYCNLMLTGGRAAEQLYLEWSKLLKCDPFTGINFYFGDERCVSPQNRDSNFGMAMRTLFAHGLAEKYSIYRMAADATELNLAVSDYENKLPLSMDIVLLSVGDDGHIASLFPFHNAVDEVDKRIVQISAPHLQYDRISITRPVLNNASEIFVFAIGPSKEAVYKRAVTYPSLIKEIPARLVLGRTWIFDNYIKP